jgi:hypothetical protein
MLLFAAFRKESEMYTPYLFAKVVFVPFHATTPPPQDLICIHECWTQAVPKPAWIISWFSLQKI